LATLTLTLSLSYLDYLKRRRCDSINGFVESPRYLSPSTSFSERVVLPEQDFLDDPVPVPPNDPLFEVGNIVITPKSGQLYSVVSIDTSEVMEEKNGKINKSSRVFYIYGIKGYMPGERRMKRKTVDYWEFEENLSPWIPPRRPAALIPPKKARKTTIPTSHPLGCECKEWCAVIEEACVDSETEKL
jgi:hypothetical protein